jgi:hypothetical protein
MAVLAIRERLNGEGEELHMRLSAVPNNLTHPELETLRRICEGYKSLFPSAPKAKLPVIA